MNYKKLIEGKRVIFVGAWPGLSELGLGKFIDDFDIIVKTNGSVFFNSEGYKEDYGSRIDVLYTNNQFYRNMKPFPFYEWSRRGIKHIRMKTCLNSDLKSFNEFITTDVIKETMIEVNKVLPSATMGAYIYTDILKHNPKEFFLIGVDFFVSKNKVFKHDDYREYLKGYLPDKIRHEGNKINIGKNEDGHNFFENAKYIYDLYMNNNNFKMMTMTLDLLEGIVNGEIKQK